MTTRPKDADGDLTKLESSSSEQNKKSVNQIDLDTPDDNLKKSIKLKK